MFVTTRKLICVNSTGYLCWSVTYLWKHARYSNVYMQPMYADMHVYSGSQNQYFSWQHWINTCSIIFANQDSDFLMLGQQRRCFMWTLYDKVLWGDISEYLPRGDTKVCHPRCRKGRWWHIAPGLSCHRGAEILVLSHSGMYVDILFLHVCMICLVFRYNCRTVAP